MGFMFFSPPFSSPRLLHPFRHPRARGDPSPKEKERQCVAEKGTVT